MANFVYNTVYFKAEDVDKVKALVCTDENGFDFNAIIPMPRSLNVVAGSVTAQAMQYNMFGETANLHMEYPDEDDMPQEEMFFDGSTHPRTWNEFVLFASIVEKNKELYGHADWYDWRNRYWNVKWNACDVSWDGGTVSFYTPWADPDPVFLKLSEMLGIEFTVECEEESLAYCSVAVYNNGDCSREEAEGLRGLVLLGQDREDIIARYSEWYDGEEEEMAEIEKELDMLGIH